jgi:hypothetical protein
LIFIFHPSSIHLPSIFHLSSIYLPSIFHLLSFFGSKKARQSLYDLAMNVDHGHAGRCPCGCTLCTANRARGGPVLWNSAVMSETWNLNMVTLWLCQDSYWKWPFIVDFPISSMVIFHSYGTVYQRVFIFKGDFYIWILNKHYLLFVNHSVDFYDRDHLMGNSYIWIFIFIVAGFSILGFLY